MRLTLTDEQLRQQVRYFAYYQLLTGLFTLGFILLMLASSSRPLPLYVACSGVCLAAFIICCGYLTLKHPRRGLRLSRYHLATQFLSFAAGGVAFRFFAGPFVAAGFELTADAQAKIDAGFGELIFRLTSGDTTFISVNLVALALFLRTTQWVNEWNYRYPVSPDIM